MFRTFHFDPLLFDYLSVLLPLSLAISLPLFVPASLLVISVAIPLPISLLVSALILIPALYTKLMIKKKDCTTI